VDGQVPLPDGGVEPAGEGDDVFGAVAHPGLQVLDAEVLLELRLVTSMAQRSE
jgi:hypothetical protein